LSWNQLLGISCGSKVQAFLSWFSRSRLLPTIIASRPPETDFIGSGVIARVPTVLIEGAINRSVNPDPMPRVPRISRAGRLPDLEIGLVLRGL
jgi:hypothetical protein